MLADRVLYNEKNGNHIHSFETVTPAFHASPQL